MVRLKGYHLLAVIIKQDSFNSTMVRLKVGGLSFSNAASCVSIPQWFD